jgi:hypothetical protein
MAEINRVPDSPARRSGTANPLKSDPTLIVLMEKLDLISSYNEFQKWKLQFLSRLDCFLLEGGSSEADRRYESFRNERMSKVIKKVGRVSDCIDDGSLSDERVSVKARNAMNELSVNLLDTVQDLRNLIPPTTADEASAGYTKFHIGSVLVRDGFQEYERMQMCKEIMSKMKETCLADIGDEKMIESIRKYDDGVQQFVTLMEDLGLYKIMLKNRELETKERNKTSEERAAEEDSNDIPEDIPPLPFLDDVYDGDEYEEVVIEEEFVEEEVEEEEEIIVVSSMSTKKEDSESSRRKTKYDVNGSWGGFSDASNKGSPTKLKVKQDLATARDSTLPNKDRKKSPQEVFVTPIRTKKKLNMDKSVDTASISMSSLPCVSSSEPAKKPPKPSSTSKLMASTHSIDSRILDSDTPRTRKKKMEWKSVKAAGTVSAKPKRVDAGSNHSKASSTEQQNNGKKRSPQKPPRPTGGKELKTKTEDTAWSMPMDDQSDPGEVWSRAKKPTKIDKNKVAADFKEAVLGDVTTESHQLLSPMSPEKLQKKSSKLPDGPPFDDESTVATVATISPSGSNHTDLPLDEKYNLSDALNSVTHESVDTSEHDSMKGTPKGRATIGPAKVKSHDVLVVKTEKVLHNHPPQVLKEPNHVAEPATDLMRVNEAGASDRHSSRAGLPRTVRGPHRTVIEGLTFCSVDDSVDPKLLGILGRCYPMVEFAVLMRHDMAGQPRYASPDWIRELAIVQRNMGGEMLLAAHLCGSLVTEVLSGDGGIDGILNGIKEMQFQRVQLNASSRHGVSTGQMERYVNSFVAVARKHLELEFTLPKNRETAVLWDGLLGSGSLPGNVSMLLDKSQGMGICPENWKTAPTGGYRVGYAGGIGFGGRSTTRKTLKEIIAAANGRQVWVSMESSMRCTKNGKDVFDINKCYEVIDVANECNVHPHPEFLVE